MSTQYSRREIIKSFIVGAAFSSVPHKSWAEPLLHELKPLSILQPGLLRVDLNDFPALNEPLGSIRISASPLDFSGQEHLGLENIPPVVINRAAQGNLHVMSAICTHAGCVVRKLDPTSERMVCPCHGSQYAVDGSVLEGPAQSSLPKLNFQQKGSVLEIDLPEVFYQIEISKSPESARIQLTFLAFEYYTYEVYFRPSPTVEAAPVPFSLSLEGPLTETEFAGLADFASVYVERPGQAGIFQIGLKTQSL